MGGAEAPTEAFGTIAAEPGCEAERRSPHSVQITRVSSFSVWQAAQIFMFSVVEQGRPQARQALTQSWSRHLNPRYLFLLPVYNLHYDSL